MDAALPRPLAVPAVSRAVTGEPELAVGSPCAGVIRNVERSDGSGLAIIQPCSCAV
ncbi:hypothetical protein [Actinomadura hibisca]|uniref:hypothetical protein n=1 Tax=Actinomadura hibisca TaxID=68565 RepID=UPI0012FCE981|nr:hypothetical protein [Actinomadura hibisca]